MGILMYLLRYLKHIKTLLAARLLLAVIIGLVISLLPAPVRAQAVDLDLINLELGGEGATSWDIEGILPCASGVKAVTLHNAGSEDGFVTIWISDIVSGEGKNPEPETNTAGEGELDDYLLFNLSTDPGGRIETNISLPTTINNLPPSVAGPGYIWINPLNSGETITLFWEWELPCETGNDAQGDTLSFTINYLLEDFLPPPPPPPPPTPLGAGTPGPDRCYMIVDMQGERTLVEIGCCTNTTVGECQAYDENLVHLFELEDETLVQCGDCEGCNCYPKIIVMSLSDDTIEPPDGMTMVGPLYDFTGYKDIRQELACDLATYFDPTATVLLNYDPELLAPGASEPVIGFFNHADNRWVLLPPDAGRVAEIGTATGVTAVFASPFAVLASAPPEETPEPPPANPSPANFVASGLSITPAEVKTGEAVTISLNVANDGEESGTYTVELLINGSGIDSKIVTLGGGEDQAVSFAVSASEADTYDASVSGLSGSFTVVKSSMWWIYLIIAAVVILLGLMALRFRRKPTK
jgi:hypothetical protein